jgi:Mg2+ and Co2+ transporter CorA
MSVFFQFCAQLFDKIPATFWGVVFGFLFTLMATYFTNRANDRRQRLQLQNDRELKNREREMAFRKETYADAAGAIAIAMGTLSRLSDLSLSPKEIPAPYLDSSPFIVKVNLVAGEETIRALANFGMEFSGAFLRLSQQRIVLSSLHDQIAAKAALAEGFAKTRDAMIELMRHHNIEGMRDARRFEEIQRNYDFEAARIDAANQEIRQMKSALAAQYIPFAKECFAETLRLRRPLIPLLVSARNELEFSITEDKYAEILEQTQSQIEGQMNEFLQKLSPASTGSATEVSN